MPEPRQALPVPLCASAALAEKGQALLFDVLHANVAMRAFALRYEGRVVAYLNRCAHVARELDWQPGEFLDREGQFILCAMHGAAYEPLTGRCAGGPCGGAGLTALRVEESRGEVYWYPSRDTRPAFDDAANESPP